MIGGNEGADNPPPFPLAIIDAAPGASEAEYRRDLEWVNALVTGYHKLRDELADLSAATGPPYLKKGATILTLVQFFLAAQLPPVSLALVLDLFPPRAAKLYNDATRGMIAAAFAVLRSANMENLQIERWLDEEIRRRPALDFAAGNAKRWFFDSNSGSTSVPRGMLEAFRSLCPAPSLSLTEAVAKERAALMLDTAAALRAGRLTRPRRHG
jgi:hypothetical protein